VPTMAILQERLGDESELGDEAPDPALPPRALPRPEATIVPEVETDAAKLLDAAVVVAPEEAEGVKAKTARFAQPELKGSTSMFSRGSLDSSYTGFSGGRATGAADIRLLGQRASNNMDSNIQELLSFQGQKYLLRASNLCSVLHRFAAILKNSAGSAHTYAMSEEVTHIDAFISHNWVVSRALKFACLTLHFNFWPALIVALLLMLSLAFGQSWGALPLATTHQNGQRGFFCTVLVAPTAMLVLCFWHELLLLVGASCRCPKVFLDKTCIHQVDKKVQQQGIKKLGAFIRKSRHMVVIYTDIYLIKLWTVYEVACFLSLHSAGKLTIIPMSSPLVIFGGLTIAYAGTLAGQFILFYGIADEYVSAHFAYAVGGLLMALVLRQSARTQDSIRSRVSQFTVDACVCFCEDDRPVVYSSIALLMRARGQVAADASDQEALTAFELAVRECLPGALVASIGPLGIKYQHVVTVLTCTYLAAGMDYYFANSFAQSHVMTMSQVVLFRICGVVRIATWTFGIFPLMVALQSLWGARCMHLRGLSEMAFVWLGVVVLVLLGIALQQPVQYLHNMADEGSVIGIVSMFAILIFTTVLARVVFTGKKPPAWKGGTRGSS